MNNPNADLQSLIEDEEDYKRLISEEWHNKISIYADMLFSMDPSDFIDFMTGSMAYASGFGAAILAATASEAFTNVCMVEPAILARDAMTMAGAAIFFGALHMLYRSIDNYQLERANYNIEQYTDLKRCTENRRYTLFPESNKSYVSSAVESVRKFVGI
ncbi:MAG TPA: hypothetical protein VL360_05705 [Gammaproteobacteria bacterium]|jgi:hypothetical protein|nr:hypothetical protein [Gammaproteobacteria bacterium]